MDKNEIALVSIVIMNYIAFFVIIPLMVIFNKVRKNLKENKHKKRRKSLKLIKNEDYE